VKQREGWKIIISEPAKRRIRNNQCPSCGKPKNEWIRRTDWRCCSVKCTDKFEATKIIRSWGDFRLKAFERDNFTCKKCGKKPTESMSDSNRFYKTMEDMLEYCKRYRASYANPRIKGNKILYEDPSQLIGDHIKPIAIGGDEWDINNIQTLCIKCNKIKTKKDMIKISKQRRIEKRLINGQKQLRER